MAGRESGRILERRLRGRLFLARLGLLWERLWPGLWPALAVLGLFLLVSLFDLWRLLPLWLHAFGLAGFALALLWALRRVRDGLHWPTVDEAMARLERDSGLAHQPLRTLTDELAAGAGDPLAQRLWQLHRRRLEALLARLRLRPPRSELPRRDPWALRAALLLALTVALVEARGEFGERLARAFLPQAPAQAATPEPTLEVWLAPPAYTRMAPFQVTAFTPGSPVRAPEGSELHVQIHHLPEPLQAPPRLRLAGEERAFEPLGGGSVELRTDALVDGLVEVLLGDGRRLGALQLEIVPDRAPEVRFAGAPEITRRRSLDLRYEATDDYGIVELALEIAPPEVSEEPGGAVERRVLLRPARQPDRVASRSFLDLTSHPRAGLPVLLTLEATDARGQKGRSAPLAIVLPERVFTHPLARRVVELRKKLVERPERWATIALQLLELAGSEDARALGAAVPLALDVAAIRLQRERTPEGRRSTVDLLWETALLIEEGTIALSERELRELQEALRRALREGASDEELQRLMKQLQEALSRYLDELARRAREQMRQQAGEENSPQPSPLTQPNLVRRQDLMQMLERARELMESGMRDAAERLLSQLQQMLENMETAMPRLEPAPGEKALSDLQRMIELQQQLLDESFRMQREGGRLRPAPGAGEQNLRRNPARPGERPQATRPEGAAPGAEQLAREQEALRRALGELMRRLGEAEMNIPRELGRAELEMRGARDALQRGRPGEATDPQTRALDLMRQGGQALLEQLRQQLANQPGPGQLPGMMRGRGRDPLGRSRRNEGGWQTEGVEIPSDYDLGRARGVLEELYRRSGERRRPAYELDYYNRLLDRF